MIIKRKPLEWLKMMTEHPQPWVAAGRRGRMYVDVDGARVIVSKQVQLMFRAVRIRSQRCVRELIKRPEIALKLYGTQEDEDP